MKRFSFFCLLAIFTGAYATPPQKEMVINHPLAKSKSSVAFVTQEYLVFPFQQAEEEGKMRSLFFQDGEIRESSSALNLAKPWCGLRVQVQEEKSTFMREKTRLAPLTFQKLSNNDKVDNYSYSFVDFSSGKIGDYKDGWRPFSLECSLPRGTDFHYARFKEITGYKIKVFELLKTPKKAAP